MSDNAHTAGACAKPSTGDRLWSPVGVQTTNYDISSNTQQKQPWAVKRTLFVVRALTEWSRAMPADSDPISMSMFVVPYNS